MRYDFENLNSDNWQEFTAYDQEMYMPKHKRILIWIFIVMLPFIGSIDTINV